MTLIKKLKITIKDSIVDIDPAKSIYLCHFNRAIDPEFIKKYFG